MDAMTPNLLAALEAAAALKLRATEGKWAVSHAAIYEETRLYVGDYERCVLDGRRLLREREDGDYLVAAANLDHAAVAAELRRLRAAVAEAERKCSSWDRIHERLANGPEWEAVRADHATRGNCSAANILVDLFNRTKKSRDALAAELAEARKVVEDAVPFIACHGAVERVKEHGNIESAENSEAILYRMLTMLGNHGAIERLGLKPAARISAGKASGGGGAT